MNINHIHGDIAGQRDFASHLVNLAPYFEATALHDAMIFVTLRIRLACVLARSWSTGFRFISTWSPVCNVPAIIRTGWSIQPMAIADGRTSRKITTSSRSQRRTTRAALVPSSWSRGPVFVSAEIVDVPPGRGPVNNGEDWFGQKLGARPSQPGMPRHTECFAVTVQCRMRCPEFCRSTWAAALHEVEDGTSNTIAMGEILPRSTAFQWVMGWTYAEGVWFATTAPINIRPIATSGIVGLRAVETWDLDFNVANGFKSRHPGWGKFCAL